jgi:hypothetical protein
MLAPERRRLIGVSILDGAGKRWIQLSQAIAIAHATAFALIVVPEQSRGWQPSALKIEH